MAEGCCFYAAELQRQASISERFLPFFIFHSFKPLLCLAMLHNECSSIFGLKYSSYNGSAFHLGRKILLKGSSQVFLFVI